MPRREIPCTDRLFATPAPDDESRCRTYRDISTRFAPLSRLLDLPPRTPPVYRVQFERLCILADRRDHRPDAPVFNRSVTLRDIWAAKG